MGFITITVWPAMDKPMPKDFRKWISLNPAFRNQREQSAEIDVHFRIYSEKTSPQVKKLGLDEGVDKEICEVLKA